MVDLIRRPRVARGDQEVAVAPRVRRDRVQVEEVPRPVRVTRRVGVGVAQRRRGRRRATRTSPGRSSRRPAARPRPAARRPCEPPTEDRSARTSVYAGQIGRALRRELQLVQVGVVAVAGVHRRRPAGSRRRGSRRCRSRRRGRCAPASSVSTGLPGSSATCRFGDRVALRRRLEPHQPPGAVDDHRAVLPAPGVRP